MSIEVRKVSDTTFQVIVESRSRTEHTVSVPDEYRERLTGGRGSAEVLVERSFEFLLEREPNTSILRRFELSVIQTYFPEYEKSMRALFT